MNNVTMKLQADPLILQALQEDITGEDVTTNAILPEDSRGQAELLAKADGIIAGLAVFARAFTLLDEGVEVRFTVKDGDTVRKGQKLADVTGSMRSILSAERVGLNYLQRMSGIATYTRQIAKLLEGSHIKLVDTRKTTPNMRVFEKYAVTVGGGGNHRYNLSDGVLLKDTSALPAASREPLPWPRPMRPSSAKSKSKRKTWTWSAKPSKPGPTSSCWTT